MITNRRILITLGSLGLVLILAAVVLSAVARSSNCGGNSYALSACRQITLYARLATPTNSSVIDWLSLDAIDRTTLFRTVTSHWTTGAGYWVRTNNPAETAEKQIIVVCDTVYDNVPQPTLWNFYHRNPAYAVGFSDGTTGLLSPTEFARMDRKDFLNLTAQEESSRP